MPEEVIEKSSLEMGGAVEVQGKQVWINGNNLAEYMDQAFDEEEFIRVAIDGVDRTEGFLIWDEDEDGNPVPTIQPLEHAGYCLCGVLDEYAGQEIWLFARVVDVPDDDDPFR